MTLLRASRKPEPKSFLPLSTANLHILLALSSGEKHGYGIMGEVRETTKGGTRLGPGTLYRSIQWLVEQGLVEESTRLPRRDEDQRRRYYALTGLGRKVLIAESLRLADVVAIAKARNILQNS
jgi:DNA-binding PadR family transcriptional regulator